MKHIWGGSSAPRTAVGAISDLVDELLGARPYQEAYLAFYRAVRSLPALARPRRKKSEEVFLRSVLEDESMRARL